MPNLRRFGVVSDEIHQDPDVAFRVANELGMGSVDLNAVWNKSIADVTELEAQRLKELLRRYGLDVTLLAGPAFKSFVVAGHTKDSLLDDAQFQEHMRVLERSILVAKALNARYVRVFGFRWPHMQGLGNPSPRRPHGGEISGDELDLIVCGLRAACALAERHDVVLGIENVRSCYANSGRNTGLIVDAVASDRLKVVWDPGNAFVSGEEPPYPGGYEAVKKETVHVHAKDARVVDASSGLTAWECIDEGEVGWAEQLARLAREYEGPIALETHWRPADAAPEAASRASFAALVRLWSEVGGD